MTYSRTNPFNPQFGKRPESFVGRSDILDSFMRCLDDPNAIERCSIISGVRGNGKTSILADVSTNIGRFDHWVVIDVTATNKMLDNILGELLVKMNAIESNLIDGIKGVNINTPLLSLELAKREETSGLAFQPAMLVILEKLKQRGINLLITIDEITSSDEMREFATAYQIFIRKNYDVAILMAGLPNHISTILNDKVMTFLRRANQIFLSNIDTYSFKLEYERIFSEESATFDQGALERAYISTDGYPYLFQLIGYNLWLEKKNIITNEDVLLAIEKSKGLLYKNVYDIVFSELSSREKEFLFIMSEIGELSTIKEIRTYFKKSAGYVSTYRERLINAGVIISEGFGEVKFTLPFFRDFLLERKKRLNLF